MWNLLVTSAGVLSTPVLCVSYLPQIVNLIKTKKTDGVSLSFWFILDLSLLMMFILALDTYIKTGEYKLAIAQALNLVFAVFNTALVVYYKKKGRKENGYNSIGRSVRVG